MKLGTYIPMIIGRNVLILGQISLMVPDYWTINCCMSYKEVKIYCTNGYIGALESHVIKKLWSKTP